ncbi:MAG: hypothetical protein CSA35_01740 [Dethiosulfovibrio peptidovorans]|nr:MAG: hypothetical protein CSA35_01740 [Dethiosulfovibrio peptidovorans]
MESVDITALLTYVIATNYSPGPNNISAAAMGARWGLRRSWGYILGIVVGFFVIMFLCGFLSSVLTTILPGIVPTMRWIGGAYILWLAYSVAKSAPTSQSLDEGIALRGFVKGLALQFVNPKVILYGLTLYGAFLAPILGQPGPVLLSSVLLSLLALTSLILWTAFGAGINRYFQSHTRQRLLNGAFALLLIYTAASVVGLL